MEILLNFLLSKYNYLAVIKEPIIRMGLWDETLTGDGLGLSGNYPWCIIFFPAYCYLYACEWGKLFFWIWKEHGSGNLMVKSAYGYLLAMAIGSHQS